MMRKFSATLLLLAISLGSLLGTSVQAAVLDTSDLSPVGQQAFADVSTCLTSGKNPTLDVFYLIDNSGSLSYTDPDNVRQQVLESSVAQLESLSAEGIKVSMAASTFSVTTSTIQSWTTLGGPAAFKKASKTIHNAVSNDNLESYTNWYGGLLTARNAFKSRSTDSCKMLIWFTDGGIKPSSNIDDITVSLKKLCNTEISSKTLGTANGPFGLMNQMRNENISIFGILYQNDRSTLQHFDSDPTPGATSDEMLELEHYLMSYMVPLTEGRGQIMDSEIAAALDLPPGGTLTCANVDASGLAPAGTPNGAFLNAKDPVGLSFQFLKLQNTIDGGSGSTIKDNKFNIPNGTAKFKILTPQSNWALSSPDGKGLSLTPKSAASGAGYSIEKSNGVTQISVDVADASNYVGQWKFSGAGNNSELFVYSGLTMILDRDKQSQVIADRPNTLTGQVVHTAEFASLPVNLSQYSTKELVLQTSDAAGKLTNISNNVQMSINDAGQFKIENYTPTNSAGEKAANLWLTLNLGKDFQPVQSEFAVSLMDPHSIAVPTSEVILLSPLDGPKGSATGKISIEGPTEADKSEFCLDPNAVRTSDAQSATQKVDRAASFVWSFDGVNQTDNFCVTVNKGETKEIQVTATNAVQADSHVVSIRNYESSAGAAKLAGTLQFEFDSKAQVNSLAMILSILLLTVLGFILPLLGLYFFNLATTKFLPTNGLVRATYPVQVTSSGDATVISQQGSGSAIQVGNEDFKPIGGSDKGQKIIELASAGKAVARVSFWPPLTAPWFEVQSPPGTRTVSVKRGAGKHSKIFDAGVAREISPNMGDNWMLNISESELRKPAGEHMNGMLTVFSRMGNIGDYQSKVSGIGNNASLSRIIGTIRNDVVNGKPAKTRGKSSKNNGEGGGLPPLPPTPPGGGLPPAPGSGGLPVAPSSGGLPPVPGQSTLQPPPTPPAPSWSPGAPSTQAPSNPSSPLLPPPPGA